MIEDKKRDVWLDCALEAAFIIASDGAIKVNALNKLFNNVFDRAYELGKQESMQLSDVKSKIDEWMNNHTEEEV